MSCRYILPVAAATIALASAQAWAGEDDENQSAVFGAAIEDEMSLSTKTAAEPEWQIRPRWRLQYDIAKLEGPVGLSGTGTIDDIRRAQLGVDLLMPSGFSARIHGEFSADPIELADAYVAWDGKSINVTAGQQKAFTPLDDMTGDLNISFLERASIVTAFGYIRRTGISAGYASREFGIDGGIFTDPLMMLDNVESNSISVDLRSYWSPNVGKSKLHFGGSYHYRDLNDFEFTPTRYALRPQIRITDIRYIGTPALPVSREQRYGLEAAGVWGRLHGALEVHWLKASRIGLSDPKFFGAYAEAGMFLTNDSRPLTGGAFGAIRPRKPVGRGGFGALQVNFRYDHLDLIDADVIGGMQDGYLASLIWTPVENMRLLLQYSKLKHQDAAVPVAGDRRYSVDLYGMRGQLSF